ncbi:hypothetical protein EJB05_42288, partial [Eragrostis curvula]
MDDGPDCGECVVVCCLACCEGACEACAASDDHSLCGACVLAGLAALALVAVLVAAFAFVVPVRVSVDEASLGRLALLAAPPGTNGTGAAESSFSYDISLGVALRNPNWAMRAWRTGPLDAELRFRGIPFARARLASAEWDRIRPRRREVYRVAAAATESAPMAIGSDGAAEFARERAAGVFEVELVASGEAKYEAHSRRHSFRVSCPLKLSLSTATAPAAFARVKCT